MIDVKKLKSIMVLNDMNSTKLAQQLGISRKTLNTRFNSGVFMTDEVEKIIEVLNIKNPIEVFFPKYYQESS